MVKGTISCPRACVFRSLRQIEVQLIDDVKGNTLLHVSSSGVKKGKGKDLSEEVGKKLAEEAANKGIKKVVFDRNGYMYHGRIKKVAEAMRAGGLQF